MTDFHTEFAKVPHISASAIADYLSCPLLWYGRRVGKWPEPKAGPQTAAMAIGTAIHAALAAHHQGDDAEVALLTAWRDVRGLELPRGAFDRALVAVGLYCEGNPARQPYTSDLCETFVRTKIPGVPVPLIGFVDRLDRDNVIHEYKSGLGRYWTQERVDTAIQATAYWYAFVAETEGVHPVAVVYHVLHTSAAPVLVRELSTTRTNDQLDAFARLCQEVYHRMTETEPVAGCRPGHCRFPAECAAWEAEHGRKLAPDPLRLEIGVTDGD